MKYSKFFPLFILLSFSLVAYPTQDASATSRIAFDNSDISLGSSNVCVVNALDVAVDDVVVLMFGDGGFVTGAEPTIADEDTNTWVQRFNADDDTQQAESYLFTSVITTANVANDITITWVGAGTYLCAGHVYSGVDPLDPVFQVNGAILNTSQTIQRIMTPDNIDNIMVGICQSDWNSAHTQTFDSTTTGTERHELNQGGGDKMGMSTIDMVAFTDVTQKEWTCDDAQSNRDISSIMVELNNSPVNPVDPMTMTDLVSTPTHNFELDPMTMTDVMTPTKAVSFTIENPMTMTDVVTASIVLFHDEEDPMSMTDEQHYDISIIIENPMTMTDSVSTPTHNFPLDPMTMTDIVTFDTRRIAPLLTYYEENTVCTNNVSSNTDIVRVTDLTDFDFISGRSYLIMASARFLPDDATTDSAEVRLLHGTTEFEGSANNIDPQNGGGGGCGTGNPVFPHTWMTVWEPTGAEADEDIVLQAVPQGGTNMFFDQGQITIIEISERFDKDRDWFFNEQTADNDLGLSWDTPNDATITFTPFNSNDKWLIMCTNQLDPDSITRSLQSRLNLITDNDVTYQQNDAMDNSVLGQLLHTFVRPVVVESTSHTFECEAQISSSGDSSQRLYSSIFAINLDKFNEDEGHYEITSQAVPDIAPDYQLMDSFTFAPDHTADYLVLACVNLETANLSDSYFGLRYQANNVDQPPSQTTQNLSPADANEAGGQWNFCSISIEPYTRAVAVTIDIDGSDCAGCGNQHADRTIQFVSLEDGFVDIENPMTMTDNVDTVHDTGGVDNFETIEDPLTMTDDQRVDVSIIIENPMTVTDDERFDVSIGLDNPITMTDDMNMIERTRFTSPENPITMTDEQHYDITVTPEDPMTITDDQRLDISIRIENPMTVTDDQRFDTSIKLDNPITMTDVVTAFKEIDDLEQDPITMTDNQRFDISIIIENPMTMTDVALAERTAFATLENPLTLTDEQTYDISIIIENPMTMTDVMTPTKEVSVTIENPMTMTDDQRLDTSIRLDNPITMTDDMNMIERTRFTSPENPITITDDQRYDISIIIENPITMTDDQRFDTSIRLDNPITMTDDVTPVKFKLNIEEDPITMTDDQRFDISIRNDDPVTMTDIVNTVHQKQDDEQDPITMTDIMTPIKMVNTNPVNPITLTDVQRYDISIIIENPMTVTDDQRLDTSILIENPITMTDDMNMIDLTKFATLENPLTLTDDQRYDISIIIENPMTVTDEQHYDTSIRLDNPITMTDDERFDTSIRLDNPITMTDDMNMIDRTAFADLENPLTLTDEQRLDISIRLENPMTVTDDQRFDTSIRLDNPMRMTDIMTPDHTEAGGIDNFETIENPMTLTQILTLLCVGVCPEFPLPPSGGGGDPTPIDPDSDNDGVIDSADACPLVFGLGADGCPIPVEEPLDELPLLDLTFPLEFNELDIVDDFIILETQFPQPQVEDLGIRWLSDEQITITSIEIGQSPFEIKVENIPVTIGDDSFGFTQTQLIYTVQEPDKICGVNTTLDCLDEVTYEIPVKITGISDGKTIIADGSITIDNSGRTNPYWLALFGLVAVPILALLFWKRRKVKPKKKSLLKITNSKTVKDQKEKTKALKSGTTRKLLKDEKSSVLRIKIK